MDKDNLAALPDDIFLDIVEHLQSARDVAHLGGTCRRANNLVERDGWIPFVRRHFSSLALPSTSPAQWRGLADRLTYLDKCWEKRAFVLSEYTEKRIQGRGQAKKQSVAPSTVVEASLLSSDQEECIAWGAGENIIVQSSPSHGKHAFRNRRWRELPGATLGYRPGLGDVTALSVLEVKGTPQLAVGRADGSLLLKSLNKDSFGETLHEIDLPGTRSLRNDGPALPSPGQSAVSWTEWNHQSGLLATGQGSTVALYDLTGEKATSPSLVAQENMSTVDERDLGLIRSIKFLDTETVAIALGASTNPLRCAKITPDGLSFMEMGPTNVKMDDILRSHNGSSPGDKMTVRAVEPVGRGNLLLSAWDDGTYRLKDNRTPSAFDAVYCNRLLPYEAGSSLLVYGMDRFVAGSNSRPNIFFFDFRQPRNYHWTTAAACSSEKPYPKPPDHDHVHTNGIAAQASCEPENRKMCLWHSASVSNTFRPDATLMVGDREYDRVHTLAKASDASQGFWVGLRGAVYETRMMLAEDATVKNVKGSSPPTWQVRKPEPKITLVETGMGMRDAHDWSDSRWAVNVADWDFRFRAGKVGKREKRSRLDASVSNFKGRDGA